MRAHRHRQVSQSPERREIMLGKLLKRRRDRRQLVMGVGKRAAVPRYVLHHWQHAACKQAFRRGSAHCRHDLRMLAIGAGADNVIGALDRNIEHRQAIDIDAELEEIERVQA